MAELSWRHWGGVVGLPFSETSPQRRNRTEIKENPGEFPGIPSDIREGDRFQNFRAGTGSILVTSSRLGDHKFRCNEIESA